VQVNAEYSGRKSNPRIRHDSDSETFEKLYLLFKA
jgi:hypothetical protein